MQGVLRGFFLGLGVILGGCRGDVLADTAASLDVSKPLAEGETLARERVRSMSMVLAFSWQPAFCETATKKPECQSQTEGR